jgi:hypothetical protein
MLAIKGTYENGIVKLERKVLRSKSVTVIVTFLDEDTLIDSKGLSKKDFSFTKARQASKGFLGSFSDTVIEERRSEL